MGGSTRVRGAGWTATLVVILATSFVAAQESPTRATGGRRHGLATPYDTPADIVAATVDDSGTFAVVLDADGRLVHVRLVDRRVMATRELRASIASARLAIDPRTHDVLVCATTEGEPPVLRRWEPTTDRISTIVRGVSRCAFAVSGPGRVIASIRGRVCELSGTRCVEEILASEADLIAVDARYRLVVTTAGASAHVVDRVDGSSITVRLPASPIAIAIDAGGPLVATDAGTVLRVRWPDGTTAELARELELGPWPVFVPLPGAHWAIEGPAGRTLLAPESAVPRAVLERAPVARRVGDIAIIGDQLFGPRLLEGRPIRPERSLGARGVLVVSDDVAIAIGAGGVRTVACFEPSAPASWRGDLLLQGIDGVCDPVTGRGERSSPDDPPDGRLETVRRCGPTLDAFCVHQRADGPLRVGRRGARATRVLPASLSARSARFSTDGRLVALARPIPDRPYVVSAIWDLARGVRVTEEEEAHMTPSLVDSRAYWLSTEPERSALVSLDGWAIAVEGFAAVERADGRAVAVVPPEARSEDDVRFRVIELPSGRATELPMLPSWDLEWVGDDVISSRERDGSYVVARVSEGRVLGTVPAPSLDVANPSTELDRLRELERGERLVVRCDGNDVVVWDRASASPVRRVPDRCGPPGGLPERLPILSRDHAFLMYGSAVGSPYVGILRLADLEELLVSIVVVGGEPRVLVQSSHAALVADDVLLAHLRVSEWDPVRSVRGAELRRRFLRPELLRAFFAGERLPRPR